MNLFQLFGEIVIDGVEDAKRKIESVSKQAEDVGNKFKTAGEKISGIGQKVMPVSKAVAGVGAALIAAAESSRDYRTDMGKLETAFTTMGHSTETATQTYRDLVSVLGETDQSVEAANHLAKLCDNEKDLQTWTDICTGVFATFGDSLPIEGLTEAANETAKVGQVVGPLADALNWAGISEDEFNQKLAACNSEQERAALITEALNGQYSEAAKKYKELNGEVMNANSAQDKWRDSMAKVGEVIQPYIDTVLSTLAGVIGKVAEWFGSLSPTTQTLILAFGGIVAAIGPVLVVIGTLASAIGSLISLWPVLAGAFAVITGPVGIIIGLITLLTTGFVLLWNKCEEFRNFWVELWGNIKQIASEFIPALRTYLTTEFENMRSAVVEKCSAINTAASEKFQAMKTAVEQKVQSLKTSLSNAWESIKSTAQTAFSTLKSVLTNPFETAWSVISGIVGRIKSAIASVKSSAAGIGSIGGFSIAPHAAGGILTKPTIFGYTPSTGTYHLGGEAGPEAIAPIGVLQGYVATAVASQNAGIANAINNLAVAITDMDQNMGKNLKNALDGTKLSVNNREFARMVKGVT